MLRKSSVLVALLAVVLAAPVVHAAGGWTIGVNGGASIPSGDFKDETNGLDAKTGFLAGLEIGYMIKENICVGVDGAMVRNKHGAEGSVEDLGGGSTLTANKDKFNIMRFGAHGKYMFPMAESPVHPYVVVGGGIYNLKEDYEYTLYDPSGPTTIVFTDESDNVDQPGSRPGFKGGLGATFKATDKVNIDVQGTYNFISLDKAKFGFSSVKYIGLQAGVSFNVMPK
jgi:opacity protein-like surface antigen